MDSAFFESGLLNPPLHVSSAQSLDYICDLARSLLGGQTAYLLLNTMTASRVIACSGPNVRFKSKHLPPDTLRLCDDNDLLVDLPSDNPAVMLKLAFLEQSGASWLYRVPIIVADHVCLVLLIAGAEGQPKPSPKSKKMVPRLRLLFFEGFSYLQQHLVDPHQAAVPITLEMLADRVTRSPDQTMLFDDSLRIAAASKPMAARFGKKPQDMIGTHRDEIELPMADAISPILRAALRTHLSPPTCELVDTANHSVSSLSVSPLNPLGTDKTYLLVNSLDMTGYSMRKLAVSKAIRINRPADPTLAFLRETLVARRTIRSRNSVSYLTLRSWRAPIRTWQISALKALKADIPAEMPGMIAEEFIAEISSLVGASGFRAIVPIPCSHSCEQSCLSLEIARAIAAKLRVPVVQAFAALPPSCCSHPKKNKNRPPLVVVNPVHVPILLVDDVATSGAHLEEAITALRPYTQSVLAAAWIGGDSR